MDLNNPILYVSGLLCSAVWGLCLLGAMIALVRLSGLRTVERLQARLESWAAGEGCTIVRQERPSDVPGLHPFFTKGPLSRLLLPGDSPWLCDVQSGKFGMKYSGYSTRVVLADRQGRFRRGRMRYTVSALGTFLGQDEALWEEDDAPWTPEPTSPEAMSPAPRDHPLWDRSVD